MEVSAGERVIVNPLRIKSNKLNELESSLVLCYTREREGFRSNHRAAEVSNVTQDDRPRLTARWRFLRRYSRGRARRRDQAGVPGTPDTQRRGQGVLREDALAGAAYSGSGSKA
jgi:hypothetical protein